MPIIEVAVVPVGTGDASMAHQVEAAQEAARRRGVKHQVTPTATILEGELDNVLGCAREMHEAALQSGSPRVVTHITIDQRSRGDDGAGGRGRERQGEAHGGGRTAEGRYGRTEHGRQDGEAGPSAIAGADQRIPAGRAR